MPAVAQNLRPSAPGARAAGAGDAALAAPHRAAELHGVQRGRFKPQTTDSAHGREPAPNWLGKVPMPSALNQILVADITYVWTEEGWLYVAGVLDLCSRRIVGLASAGHLETSLPPACSITATAACNTPASIMAGCACTTASPRA